MINTQFNGCSHNMYELHFNNHLRLLQNLELNLSGSSGRTIIMNASQYDGIVSWIFENISDEREPDIDWTQLGDIREQFKQNILKQLPECTEDKVLGDMLQFTINSYEHYLMFNMLNKDKDRENPWAYTNKIIELGYIFNYIQLQSIGFKLMVYSK